MAKKDHLNILEQGVANWNNWRGENPSTRPDLRGADFKNKDFTGADFSNAFIQGAKFNGATLQGAKFIDAEAGVRNLWKIMGVIGSFIISLMLGVVIPTIVLFFGDSILVSDELLLFVLSISLLLGFILVNLGSSINAALWVVAMVTISMSLVFIPQPLFIALAFTLVLVVFFIIFVNLLLIIPEKLKSPIIVTVSLIFTGFGLFIFVNFVFFKDNFFDLTDTFFSWYEIHRTSFSTFQSFGAFFSILTAIGVALSIAKGGMVTGWHKIIVVIIAVFMPLSLASIILQVSLDWDTDSIVVAIEGFLGIFLGVYIGWRALQDDPRYVLVRNISLNLGAWGNTSFRDADLTNADFAKAKLQHADLRGADITHTNWYGAKQIAYARVGRSYLQSPQVRKLVIGKSGENNNFDQLDLSGIKLPPHAILRNASFIGTNLTGADLQEADLSEAMLVESNLDEANLDRANITGACVENWRITAKTQLNAENLTCDYLYMRKKTKGDPNRLREPKNEKKKLTLLELEKLINKFVSIEKDLEPLYRIFDELYLIRDKIIREYRLIECAKKAKETKGIPLASYRQMFEDYRRKKIENEWQKHAWMSIFSRLEGSIERVNNIVREMDIFPILERLSQLSVIVAVFIFINQVLKEQTELRYRAWEIINSESSRNHGGTVIVLKNWKKYDISLQGINAKNAGLKNIDLSDADLTSADFSESDLENANLSRAILKKVKFINANLKHANFSAGVSSFNASRKRQIKKEGADLSGADFSGAKLIGANLSGAKNLSQAKNLNTAKLIGTNLRDTDLADANLKSAILKSAILKSAILKSAILSDANLSDANLIGANLAYANLIGANLSDAYLTSASLNNAKLPRVILYNANLSGANLGYANLSGADLGYANLSDADLTGANLSDANLSDADLTGANLSDADLSATIVENALFLDNKGISESMKQDLIQRRAIFK